MSRSYQASALIGFTKSFKTITRLVEPTPRRVEMFNTVCDALPNPFFTHKIATPFKLKADYGENKNDFIDGEILMKKYHSMTNTKMVVLYIHGGAFMTFTYKKARLLTSLLGTEADCPVISFDYRCGRKYPFPHALMDTY